MSLLLVIAALVIVFGWTGVGHVAAQAGSTAVVTTGQINIRSGPGPGYASLGTAVQGERLTMLGRDSALSWIKVRNAANREGWVSSFYLDADVPFSSLPVLAQAEPWAVVNTPVLNVRSGPGSTYSVVTTIPQGRLVTLVGRTSDNAFAQILTNGVRGWVTTLYIRASVPISSLPMTFVPPTATPTPRGGTPAPTAAPGGGGAGTPVPAAVPAGATGTVTTGQLNVRTGPGPGYGSRATLSQGDVVTLLGRDSARSWLFVRTASGVQGWVSSFYIQATVPLTSLPVLAQTQLWAQVTTGTLNVRSGPDSSFSVVTTVNEGRLITLLGRNADNSWVKIVTDGIEGWVTTLHIQPSGPVSSLPIVGVSSPTPTPAH